MTQHEITTAVYPNYAQDYSHCAPADRYGYSSHSTYSSSPIGSSHSTEREYHYIDSAHGLLSDHSTSASDVGEQRHNLSLEQRGIRAMPPVESSNLQTLKATMAGVADTTRQVIVGAKLVGERVGAVTTPILGSLSRGVTQTFVDAQQYDQWASASVESWGWNASKFGYACGLAVRGTSTLVGGAVGLAHGVFAGGKQAYDGYNNEGVFKGAWQAFSNAFYACEPTRFSAPVALNNHAQCYRN